MTAAEIDLTAVVEDDAMEVPDEEIREFEQAHADLAWVTDKARRLRDLQARRAEHGAILQSEIDRLELEVSRLRLRAVEIDAPMGRYAEYLTACLTRYALRERERTHGRVKSVKLLFATIKTSTKGGGWTPGPDAVAWAKANRPELVAESLKTADAKRLLTFDEATGYVIDKATGQAVPGIEVAPKVVTATVDIEDPA